MNWNERLSRILLLGATLALAWIGQGLLRAEPRRLLDGTVILVLAAIAFVSLVAWSRGEAQPQAEPAWVQRLRGLTGQAPHSVAFLAPATILGAVAFWFAADPALQPWPALLAWMAGIGLLLAGAWSLPGQHQRGDRPRATITLAGRPPQPAPPGGEQDPAARGAGQRSSFEPGTTEARVETRIEYLLADEAQVMPAAQPAARWEAAVLLGLTLGALLVRGWALTSIPLNFGGDEGEMGMVARSVLRGELRDPFATAWLSHPTLWFFLQALSLRIFGDNVFGLRMLSMLIGTATIPALYLFARPLYGRAIALTATALLAFYHFHIHFSRLAVNNIADPPLALVAFGAFLHGYRTRTPFSFALAGVMLGLAQHFYMGSRLAPLVLLAVLAHQLLLDRPRLLGMRWHLGLLALGFVLGFGPLLRYFILHPDDFNARLAMTGIFQTGWFAERQAQGQSVAQIMIEQARAAFGGFIFEPDRSPFYDPRIPLLDRTSSILFVLGLALVISRWRRPESLVLLAWLLGVVVFGGMLLVGPPLSPRYVTAAPVMCLLIALALDRLEAVLGWALPLRRRFVYSLGAVAVLLLALWNLNFYFREYTPRRTYSWLNTEVATEMGSYLSSQADAVYVYFFGPPRMFFSNGTIRFLAPDVPGMDVLEPIIAPDQLPPPPSGRRPIFIFLPERVGELQIVQERYPGGALRRVNAVSEQGPLFFSYEPK